MKERIRFYLPILLILMLAALIRCFNYTILPYSHDELSALSRLNFNGLGELVEKGVRPDGHPALIQVFLYYWIKIGGNSEEWVKLPFILAGLFSIFLVFRIGNRWFGKNAGLFAALFMAFSQFFIIYSQYARPYVSGMFFSLLALSSFLEIVFSSTTKKKHWFIFSLALTLCALNHHISALFAFLLAVLGFLFLRAKKKFLPYFFSCGVAVLLYLPHLGITLSQFSIGGLSEWLSVPGADFIFRFLFFLLHYSVLPLLAIVCVLALSFTVKQQQKTEDAVTRIRLVLILLFLLSFLIPFLYSVYKAPIMQFSTLIFSAPCLALLVFSFVKNTRPLVTLISALVLSSSLLFTLYSTRKFFELNHHQAWQEMVLTANHFIRQNPEKKIISIARSEPYFVNYYLKKYKVPDNFILEANEKFLDAQQLNQLLDSCKADVVIVSNLQPQQLAQIATHYPVVLARKTGYNFEITALAKEGKPAETLFGTPVFYAATDFSSQVPAINADPAHLVYDSVSGKNKFAVLPQDEYILNFLAAYKNTAVQEGNHVLAELVVEPTDSLEGLLCVTVKNDSATLFFTATEMRHAAKGRDGNIHVYTSMFVGKMESIRKEQLNIFIWNKGHKKFNVRNFNISVINSNPLKFSLLDKIGD